jgi:hypothetical protein
VARQMWLAEMNAATKAAQFFTEGISIDETEPVVRLNTPMDTEGSICFCRRKHRTTCDDWAAQYAQFPVRKRYYYRYGSGRC